MTDSDQRAKFNLSLFGRFELTGPGGIVHLRGKKLEAFLSYMACTAPRPQSRDKLAKLLWGSHFEIQARQNLRHALFRLRRILGQDAFITSDDEISLSPYVIDCDVARFEGLIVEGSHAALDAAVELYRDSWLTDLNVPEEAWSDWRAAERGRLQGLAVDSMVRRGQQALQLGDADSAIKNANRAISVNALREDAHRLNIHALATAGRKAEALKHYQDFVALLKRELNAEPDAETQSLVAELRGAKANGTSHVGGEIIPHLRAQSEQQTDIAPTGKENAASTEVAISSGSLEQRQLTIMACNLIGSITSAASLDPEDVHSAIAAFHTMVTEVVARFDGYVAQYQGYGALIYFGYPSAHEHDAERAVRAGLAILDEITGLKAFAGETIEASIGVATGLVVVGKEAMTDHSRHHIAVGETPDLAMRLQAEAAAGEVVIAASTRQLVGGMFDCRERAPIAGKGLQRPLQSWQVRGENAGVSRFDARRGGSLYPLVGRQDEIELLARRWNQVKAGQGRVVLISGEPGIGKSRIVESVTAKLADEPHALFRYFCSPHHTQSPLRPFIERIEQQAGFQDGDTDHTRFEKLEALLKPTTKNLPRDVALFSELLGVPMDGRHPALTVSPQQKREMTLRALLDRFDDAASQRPVLIMFEDVHWIDPTSLDLLERMVASVAKMSLLLLVTSRPEFQPNWVGEQHVTTLSLSRLGPSDSADIVRGIAQDRSLPDEVVQQILSRTDGVPLFIEELTRTLLESGLLRETADRYLLNQPLPPLAIPTSLQASLAARLDLLGSAKNVAMIGAAIGREFSYELIAAVSALAPTDLDAALARLTASGLISRRGTAPDAIYSFKHALLQDAAYVTMLKSRRRQLHESIAQTLVAQCPELTESQPEIVARHFTEAGLAGEAIAHWVKAGRNAQARWANREAASFFEHAIGMLQLLPESRETLKQAVDLRFDLKTSLIPLGQFERILSCLREADNLAERLDDQRRRCQLAVHLCQTLSLSGNPKDAVAFGQDAQTLAESLGDLALRVAATLFLGTACFSTLDYREAEHHFLKVLLLLDGELSLEQFALAGFPAVSARGYLTRIYTDQGKFKLGIVHGEEGIRLAEAVKHPYSLAIAYWCLADLFVTKGELDRAIGLLERGLAVTREWNLPFLAAGNSASLGHAYALLGRTDEGLPMLEQGLSVFENMGHRFAQSLFLLPLGEACMLAGRPADALIFAGRALTLALESGQLSGQAAALHLLGEASARNGASEHAEGQYRKALSIAGGLEMRPLVARCHHGLGELYLRASQPDQAREQLTAATNMYREMGMGFRLAQADAEMNQLLFSGRHQHS